VKKHLLIAATLFAVAVPVLVRAQQPPIIDRKLFFGEIEIAGAQISPDGQYLSFLKPYKGTRNIWVKKADEPFSAARPVSAEATRPVRGYFWSRDSKYLLYAQDAGGDENFNVYAVDPTLPADPKTGVPPTRALTNLKGVRTEIFAAPRSKPDVLYIGLNDRDPQFHDLYELHISTGQKTLLRKNTERIAGWDFDNDGNLKLAERTNQAGDTEILRVDADGFMQIYSCTVLEGCGIQSFEAGNKQAYLITNKGDLNLSELELLDIATGATTKVESDPENRVDIGSVETSDVDYRILFTSYEDDRYRLYFKDKGFEQEYRWLQSKLPGKEINFGARSKDENIWIVMASSDVEPGETYLWNRAAKTLVLQYRIREKLPRASLSERIPYHFKSSDGLDIPAYVTLPKGLPAKNLPLVVFPHGGPWGTRFVWLRHLRPIPLQPRLCGVAAKLPRFDRLWQKVPERRQRGVGTQDAGRPHLGRESAGSRWNRRSEAGRYRRRLLWRVCNVGRGRFHAARLRRRVRHRRALEPNHAARRHPAVLGGRSQADVYAHGRSDDPGG